MLSMPFNIDNDVMHLKESTKSSQAASFKLLFLGKRKKGNEIKY
jgi:hypothetical protein